MHLRALLGLFVYRLKWKISLPFQYTSTSEFPPLSYTWSLKKVSLRAEPPRKGHYREYSTGGFSFCERKPSHVSSINDIQLLKMYRLSSKSLGEQEHPRLERGWEFIKFSWVLGSAVQPKRNQIFASSFRWTLKIQCKFGRWRHLIYATSGILQ